MSHNERTFDPAKAARLDDPARQQWLPPGAIIDALGLRRCHAVADIGAGTGYFSIPISKAVPTGRVFAVDLQPEMLQILGDRAAQSENVIPILGNAHQTGIEDAACDVVFFANVWHELDDVEGVLTEGLRILKRGGRIAVLDWRPDVSPPPGPPQEHRVPMSAVSNVLSASAWRLDSMRRIGPYSYLVIADRPQPDES